jgi:hypothetical protein
MIELASQIMMSASGNRVLKLFATCRSARELFNDWVVAISGESVFVTDYITYTCLFFSMSAYMYYMYTL